MKKELEGNFLVILTEGDIIPATKLEPSSDGIIITTGKTVTCASPDMLEAVYPLNTLNTLEELYARTLTKNDLEALTRTLCGVTEANILAKKFAKQRSVNNPNWKSQQLEIILFGSASLALTILPSRVSHDIDCAVSIEFAEFCQNFRPKSRGAELELLPPRLLQYLGEWRERAGSLTTNEVAFKILHPLDTVMQKLLRTEQERFDKNDKKDITATLNILSPSKTVLLDLLTENPSRYRTPKDKEIAKAIQNNTTWFLKTFIGKTTYKELCDDANAREEHLLSKYGFLKKSSIPIKKIPNPNRKLADYIKPPQNYGDI